MRPSRIVMRVALSYLESLKCTKTRERIVKALDLAAQSKVRQLKPYEWAALSKVSKHLNRINRNAEAAIARARRKEN